MNKQAVFLTKKLIKFQSDADHPGQIEKCFLFVVENLKKANLIVKKYRSGGKPSLMASRKDKKHFEFILNGHLDVVPANYKGAFTPVVKGNRLYGRGSADMKGNVSVLVEIMKNNELKHVDMALMLTFDEEIGGSNGVDYLLTKQGYSCNCAIVPDGGNNFHLILNEKGIIHIKMTAKGKATHASRPWDGENAIEKLLEIYKKIKKQIPSAKKNNTWAPTLNLGKITGGDAINKVPDYAEMYLDFRYPKKNYYNKIMKTLNKLVRNTNGVKHEILVDGSEMSTSINNKYVKRILETAKNKRAPLTPDKDHPASDGRFFSAKGIPVIMFNPKCSQGHVKNEWVDVNSLEKVNDVLVDFLKSS